MGKTQSVYTFKCTKGHVFDRAVSLGTCIDDYDETTCDVCLKTQVVTTAYVISVGATSTKGTIHAGTRP